MFRKAGINDPDVIDNIRNQVAVNFASSVMEGRYAPSRGTVGAYLWGLVRNTCRSEIRRAKRFPKLSDDFSEVVNGQNPAASAESHEVQQIIRSALAELPPRYRVALCAEYGIRDVEDAIPTPVEPRNDLVLFRARRRLRDLLRTRCSDIAVLFQ